MTVNYPTDDFWEASSLGAHNVAGFAARLRAHTEDELPLHPLTPTGEPIDLPHVNDRTQRLLQSRRSGRTFRDGTLSTKTLGRLLAAVGESMIPAAGGIDCVFTYVMGGDVAAPFGDKTFQYRPKGHTLARVGVTPDPAERRRLFSLECDGDPQLLICTVIHLDELRHKYGDRSLRFALQQVGHAQQNLALRAGVDDLAAYVVGGALDNEVLGALGISHTTACLGGAMAIGLA